MIRLHPLYRGILCCSLAIPTVLFAQESGPAVVEEIIVTGSLIRGSSEDAALPVQVFDDEHFRLQGNPDTLEFMRSLSSIGETMGQVNSFKQAYTYGMQRFNLRNVGGDKTLTLVNGRRASQDTSFLPTMAMQRIEVLKDGAAVTYGADAVGGVVNFITKTDFEGFEVSGDFTHIQDTDGDYKLSMLGGWNHDNGNVMVGAEYQRKSELSTRDRNWAIRPESENPKPFSPVNDAAVWSVDGLVLFGTEIPWFVSDADADLCDALNTSFSEVPVNVNGSYLGQHDSCAFGYAPYYNLQEEQDLYKFYVQANGSLSDTTSYRVDLSYGRSAIAHAHSSPLQPVVQGPAVATGLTNQFVVGRDNPYFQAWLDQAVADGKISAARAAMVNQGSAQYFRPFAFGGNPAFSNDSGSAEHERYSANTRFNAELDGSLLNTFAAPVLGDNIYWTVSATYSQTTSRSSQADLLGYRYQDALDGFGGPNCYNTNEERRALDTNYSTNRIEGPRPDGCLYINPFSSAWSHHSALGYENPNYVPGGETSKELAKWLMDDRKGETASQAWTIDAVFSGQLPVSLPGGNIGWAFGGQWREEQSRTILEGEFYDRNQTPCAYPDQTLVSDEEYAAHSANGMGERYCTRAMAVGPYTFNPQGINSNSKRAQYSFYAQADLPITDTLNASLAVRDETFDGGLGATVYKVSGKWQATDWFAIRGSYGDNYSAPPVGLRAGDISTLLQSVSAAGGVYIPVRSITDSGIKPETAIAWNVGLLFNGDGFTDGSYFNASIDYFNIELEDEIVSLDYNTIATSTLMDTTVAPGTRPDTLINCSAPLIGHLRFKDGSCVQGVTVGRDIIQVDRPRTNGPSRETSGIDINADYTMPLLKGMGTLGTSMSYTLDYTIHAFSRDGIEYSPKVDTVGYANYDRAGPTTPEWRGNVYANFRQDAHNLRLVFNYISSVKDESLEGVGGFGSTINAWKSWDLHYTMDELFAGLRLSASVINLTDEAPPQARLEYSYDPMIGNPLGRMIRLSATKRF